MRIFLITLCLFSIKIAYAEELSIPDSFKIDGEFINPKCVEQLETWISDGGIIVQAIVLETCQGSDLAFEGEEYQWQKDNTVGYNGSINPDVPAHNYAYTHHGMLSDNKHILSRGSSLAVYEITKKRLAMDVLYDQYDDVHILSKIAEIGFVHCLHDAHVSGNKLIVTRRVYYPDAPRAYACDNTKTEQIEINLSKVQ